MQVSFECYVCIQVRYMEKTSVHAWQELMCLVLVRDWKTIEPRGTEHMSGGHYRPVLTRAI